MSVHTRGQQEPSVMSGAEEQRFADSHPLRLFPTFVWRAELADNVRAQVNASVLKAIEESRGSLPPLKPGLAVATRPSPAGTVLRTSCASLRPEMWTTSSMSQCSNIVYPRWYQTGLLLGAG